MPRELNSPPEFFIPEKKRPRELDTEKMPSRLRSIFGAPVKGAIKEGREQLLNLPFGFGKSLTEESKKGSPLVSSSEKFEQNIEKLLPTQNLALERGLERGGKTAPYAAFGGIPGVLRGLAGGLAAEGVKELGGGPLAQALVEIGAQGAPGLSKKIMGKNAAQESLINFGRKMGLTEGQIAPLIQSEKKASILSKAAYRRGMTKKRLASAEKASGDIYETLRNSPDAQKFIPHDSAIKFLEEAGTKLKKLPSELRKPIYQDFLELIKSGGSGKDLFDFRLKVNKLYKHGYTDFASLLDPIDKAIASISPQLGQDIGMANQLYKQGLKLRKMLKPSIYTDLLGMGRQGAKMAAIITHNPLLLTEVIGESAARRLATEMLVNPRFQNLSRKMIHALNNNKFSIAKQISDEIIQENAE